MNVLELDIKNIENEYWLELSIDSTEFLKNIDPESNAVSFEELVNSLNGNGEYLIFTCSCGVADCGGWQEVKVSHHDQKIKWEFEYAQQHYMFEFVNSFYKGEIERMRFEIDRKGIQLEPKFIIKPE